MIYQIPDLDKIYKKYFKTPGYFVEVGAYDGVSHSNTSFLVDQGWSGTYIEPVKEFYDKCVENYISRPDINVINSACGRESGELIISVGGEWSTAKELPTKVLEAFAPDQTFKDEVVKVNRLDELVKRDVDLLIIDVEGMEWDVLYGYSKRNSNPKMMIIEMHENSPEWQSLQLQFNNALIDAALTYSGYKTIFKDEINTIYVQD